MDPIGHTQQAPPRESKRPPHTPLAYAYPFGVDGGRSGWRGFVEESSSGTGMPHAQFMRPVALQHPRKLLFVAPDPRTAASSSRTRKGAAVVAGLAPR